MEEIVGVVVEEIDESFLNHQLSEIQSHLNPSTFTGNWMYLHWTLCGDKCKYINFRNTTNFEIRLLFLAAGLLEDKAFRKA